MVFDKRTYQNNNTLHPKEDLLVPRPMFLLVIRVKRCGNCDAITPQCRAQSTHRYHKRHAIEHEDVQRIPPLPWRIHHENIVCFVIGGVGLGGLCGCCGLRGAVSGVDVGANARCGRVWMAMGGEQEEFDLE